MGRKTPGRSLAAGGSFGGVVALAIVRFGADRRLWPFLTISRTKVGRSVASNEAGDNPLNGFCPGECATTPGAGRPYMEERLLKTTPRRFRLGALALGGALLFGLVPLATGAPTANATYANGSWYCFGKVATITKAASTVNGNTFYGTANKDVIVTTNTRDMVYNVNNGDTICTRGGDDEIIVADTWIRANGWNRVKVDAGEGRDLIEVDGDSYTEDLAYGTLEAHGGPGADLLIGSDGPDTMFPDAGGDDGPGPYNLYMRDFVDCKGGPDKVHTTVGQFTYGPASGFSTTHQRGHTYGHQGCETTSKVGAWQPFAEYRVSGATTTTVVR